MLNKMKGFFDSIFESPIFESLVNYYEDGFYDILFLTLLGLIIIIAYRTIEKSKKNKKLTTIEEATDRNTKKKQHYSDINYFRKLKVACDAMYKLKSQKNKANILFTITIIAEILILLVCIIWKKPLFTVTFPIMFHYFIIKIINLATVNIHRIIFTELSGAIKQMIKVFSKTSDLKTVLYESSKTMNEPLRGMFFDLSRKMISENYEKCLIEFAEEVDDIWMYALVFLLQSYKEHSRKEDIVKILRTLADILDKENYVQKKASAERKPLATLNWVLLLLGLMVFVINIAFNNIAINFFFNTLSGMVCFLLGVACVFITIIVNIMLVHKGERR